MMAAISPEPGPPQAGLPPFILLKRPCLLIATFLIPGIVLGHCVFPRALTVWLLLPLIVFLLAALLLLVIHSSFSMPASMLVFLWVGVLLGVMTGVLPPHHVHFKLKPDRSYELRGVVVEEPVQVRGRTLWRNRENEQNSRYSFTLKVVEARDAKGPTVTRGAVTGKILVYASGDDVARLRYGDRVVLAGRAFLPQPRRNPGGFDFRKYLAQSGIYVCIQAESIETVEHGRGSPVYGLFHWLKERLRHSFSAGRMSDDARSFLHAVILGERREVGREFKEALRRTNTMHILAISGLHVGILAGAMYFFLSRLIFVPQGVSSLITILLVLSYALLTGTRPPVLRASLMSAAFLLAPVLKRRSDVINSLAFAAVVILLIRPADLFTAGFQLSFMVVLSILLLSDKLFRAFVSLFRLRPDPGFLTVSPFRRRVYRLLEYPLRLLSVSLSAFFGSLPLTLYYFNNLSLLSPFCNMIILVLVGFIVPLGFLAGFVGLLAHGVAACLNTLNAGLISALQGVVTFFSSLRFMSFNVSPPAPIFAFAFYSVILLIGFASSLRRLVIPVVSLAVLAGGLFLSGELARRHPDSLQVTFLDVGQGACIFVEFPDGRTLLVDGGSVTRGDVGYYVIVPFLRWAGVNTLDAILVTHYAADHINGLPAVLDDVKAQLILVRGGTYPAKTDTANRFACAIQRHAIPRREVRAGDTLSLSPHITASVLNPPSGSEALRFPENDVSVVVKLAFRGSSVMLSGDIEKTAERLIVHQPISPRSDVLQMPHHGSNSSSSEEFIRFVAPMIAIVSCGRGNVYGHPSPDALERYSRLGVRIFRTDLDGGITVRVFQDKLSVTTTL